MLGANITCPRSVSSQVCHASYDRACTSEQYLRWSVWYPYLDSVLMHINLMFGDKSRMPFKLCSILQCFEICTKTFQEVYKFYWHVLMCDEDVLFQELERFVVCRCLLEKMCRLHDLSKELSPQFPNVKNFSVSLSWFWWLHACQRECLVRWRFWSHSWGQPWQKTDWTQADSAL